MIEVVLGVGVAAMVYLVGLPTLLFRLSNASRRLHEGFATWAAARGLAAEGAPRPLPGSDPLPFGQPTRFAGALDGVPVGARLVALPGNNTAFTVQVWAGGLPAALRVVRARDPAERFLARAFEGSPTSAPEPDPTIPLDTGDHDLDLLGRTDGPTTPALLSRLDAPTRSALLALLRSRGGRVTAGVALLHLDADGYTDGADEAFAIVRAVALALGDPSSTGGAAYPGGGFPPGVAPVPAGAPTTTAARLAALARTDPAHPVRARAAAALATLVPRDAEARALAVALAAESPPPVALPCAAALGDLPRVLALGDLPGAPAALAATLLDADADGERLLGPPDRWLEWLARRLADEATDGWRQGRASPEDHREPLLALAARHGDARLLPVLAALADDPALPTAPFVDAQAAIRARASSRLAGAVALAAEGAGAVALAPPGPGALSPATRPSDAAPDRPARR